MTAGRCSTSRLSVIIPHRPPVVDDHMPVSPDSKPSAKIRSPSQQRSSKTCSSNSSPGLLSIASSGSVVARPVRTEIAKVPDAVQPSSIPRLTAVVPSGSELRKLRPRIAGPAQSTRGGRHSLEVGSQAGRRADALVLGVGHQPDVHLRRRVHPQPELTGRRDRAFVRDRDVDRRARRRSADGSLDGVDRRQLDAEVVEPGQGAFEGVEIVRLEELEVVVLEDDERRTGRSGIGSQDVRRGGADRRQGRRVRIEGEEEQVVVVEDAVAVFQQADVRQQIAGRQPELGRSRIGGRRPSLLGLQDVAGGETEGGQAGRGGIETEVDG